MRYLLFMCAAPALFLRGGLAAEIVDRFDRGTLNPPQARVWDPCQADSGTLIGFGKDGSRRYLAVAIDSVREGPDQCTNSSAPEVDRLGPSLIDPLTVPLAGEAPSCAVELKRDGRTITQRNELRFSNPATHGHPFTSPHWYGLEFRMQGDIPACGSVRWVTAQWKYSDASWPENFDESPFLAQRFDNGVQHVTVQSGDCRCMVAKTSGDTERREAAVLGQEGVTPRAADLVKVDPLSCKVSKAGAREGQDCVGTDLPDITIMAPSPAALESLPDPRLGWVKMLYLVRGGGDGGGRIDIYANSRFIARIQGRIGYPGSEPGRVKFKFGAYRDKFVYKPPRDAPPEEAYLQMNELCVSAYASGRPSRCDPSVRLLD